MGGDLVGETGTATATSATSLTNSGAGFSTVGNGYAGHLVVAGTVYGVIISNTATVLTVDKWYAPASPGGAAGTTPGNVGYVILAGGQPAFWLALTANATAPALADTTLTAEIATAGGGLVRAVAVYGHTLGTNTYTLTKTFTANGSDALPVVVAKAGVFNSGPAVGGRMVFESALSNTVTMNASGDSVQVTETVTTS